MSSGDELQGRRELAIYCKPTHIPPPGTRGLNVDAIQFDADGLSVNDVDHFAGALPLRRKRTLEVMRCCLTIRASHSLVFFDSELVLACGSGSGAGLRVVADPIQCERGENTAHCLVKPGRELDATEYVLLREEIAMLHGEYDTANAIEARAKTAIGS